MMLASFVFLRIGLRMSHRFFGSTATSWRVSTQGRVQNTWGVVSRGTPRSDGYVHVCIDHRNASVHRLVAMAFWGPPPSFAQRFVNHKNNIRSDNRLVNLEYVTRSENIRHSWATNTNRRTGGPASSKAVLGRLCGESSWTRFDSMTLASAEWGVHRGSISAACRRQRRLASSLCLQNRDAQTSCMKNFGWSALIIEMERQSMGVV